MRRRTILKAGAILPLAILPSCDGISNTMKINEAKSNLRQSFSRWTYVNSVEFNEIGDYFRDFNNLETEVTLISPEMADYWIESAEDQLALARARSLANYLKKSNTSVFRVCQHFEASEGILIDKNHEEDYAVRDQERITLPTLGNYNLNILGVGGKSIAPSEQIGYNNRVIRPGQSALTHYLAYRRPDNNPNFACVLEYDVEFQERHMRHYEDGRYSEHRTWQKIDSATIRAAFGPGGVDGSNKPVSQVSAEEIVLILELTIEILRLLNQRIP